MASPTVRDAGGADFGIARAVDEGYFTGPRVLFGGKALSQTGGHGDMRGPGENAIEGCFCCAGLGRVCDGADEVRRACRDEIRKGAHHIKLMVAGGIASPTDRITSTQFSVAEMTAAVEEAAAAEIYVLGHAYTARAINRALECGVRSIEHGNLMDDTSADLFLEHDAILVPTLTTYRALADEGVEAGLPAELHAQVFDVLDAGMAALELAHRRGGPHGLWHRSPGRHAPSTNSREFRHPGRGATPDRCHPRRHGKRGRACSGWKARSAWWRRGARADLLVVDGNPLEDLGVLQKPEMYLKAVMKDGTFHKSELD